MNNTTKLARCLAAIVCLACTGGSARGALFWNDSVEGAVLQAPGPGVTNFTTQTFTPYGSLSNGSVHTSEELADITLNFNGMTINAGSTLQTVTGFIQDSASTGTDSRIVFTNTVAYNAGDVLKFNFSWDNQMVSDTTRDGGVDDYDGSGASVTPTPFPLGDGDDAGWANLRHQFLWSNAQMTFTDITWTLMGRNVGTAVTAGEFYDGFGTSSPQLTNASTDPDIAIISFTGDGRTRTWVNDIVGNSFTDDFEIESFMVSMTLKDGMAAGSNFIFTFDGMTNGIPAGLIGVIPEPSSTALLGLAALAVALRRRRV